ncbi:MAG: hypothetical protein K9K78_01570 [Spirochaetales bacterium]|nr:hypothetical protein [Spirochaetales bacterium]
MNYSMESSKRFSRTAHPAKKRKLTAAVSIALLVCLLTAVSCSQYDAVNSPSGSLHLFIDGTERVQRDSITPEISMSISSYEIEGYGPSGEQFTEVVIGSSEFQKEDLMVGTWSITVTGSNADSIPIASGTAELRINIDETTEALITLLPLEGQGSADITITWPETYLENPVVSASLNSYQEQMIAMESVINENSAACSSGDIEEGYYILNLQLLESDHVVWGQSSSLRILAGENTAQEINLTEQDFNASGTAAISLEELLYPPLNVTLNGFSESLVQDSSMNLSLETDSIIDSDCSLSYYWYINGSSILNNSSQQIEVGPGLEPGIYHLSCLIVAINEAGSIVQSGHLHRDFTIQEAL